MIHNFWVNIEEVDAGWAEIHIVLDGEERIYTISYTPYDTMSEFVEGAMRVLKGDGIRIHFSLEPEIVTFVATPESIGICTVCIDTLSSTISTLHYARSILNMFAAYEHKHSRQDYAKKWGHPFPSDSLDKLRIIYRGLRTDPQENME